MRTTSRTLSLLLLVLLLAPVSLLRAQDFEVATPEEAGLDSDRLARLTAMLDHYAEQGLLPGGHLLVLRDGFSVVDHSFGLIDREAGRSMPADAIYRIASQTKAVVSVATLMLQEEGKLLIGDPVGQYLPEWMETTVAEPDGNGGFTVVPASRRITIRDLLTHTAGVGYGGGLAADTWSAAGIQGWYFADRDEPIRETVRRMAALPHEAQPGTKFVYGYSIDILGAVVEAASGQTLEAFLTDRILRPLGMRDTHFYLPRQKADRLAVVYSKAAEGLERTPAVSAMVGQGAYLDGPRKSFSGGAGLLSTARDYARFLQMVLNGGELDGVRILSRKTVDLMTRDHLRDIPYGDGVGFGLGFQIIDDVGAYGRPASEGAFGWGGAYHSVYWVDPVEELVVVYMVQVIPAGDLDDRDKVRALLYQAIVE